VRVGRGLRVVFYISFSILYISGALDFLFQPQSPEQSLALKIHGVAGLWFLVLFGHFFRSHIWPSLNFRRHRKTGITLWITMTILCLTVPLLYYLGTDISRDATVALHTYLGFAVLIPLIIHIRLAIRDRRSK
jgi:hypothetical protein